MGRLLAIDYGTRRTGIAVSDPLKIIANGLTTVRSHLLFDFLKDYFEKESIDLIVIGQPKTLQNKDSENMKNVQAFINRFQKLYPNIPYVLIDERFTSAMAKQAMIDSGLKKKARQNKELVDEISATIILQTYMESLRFK